MKNIIKQFVLVPTLALQLVTPTLPDFSVAGPVKPELVINNYQLAIKLDTQSPTPVTSPVYTPVITPGKSRFEEEQERIQAELAKTRKSREVTPRDVVRTADPGFQAKRALVKEIAGQKGIDWRVLEAVWQVETGKRWDSNVRSYAGATGPMQFMTGTWGSYQEDYDGDGVASIYDAHDSVAAAANLLKSAGLDRGDADSALFAYNHSRAYVAKVKRVADSIVE